MTANAAKKKMMMVTAVIAIGIMKLPETFVGGVAMVPVAITSETSNLVQIASLRTGKCKELKE